MYTETKIFFVQKMTTAGKNDNNEEQEDTKSIKNFWTWSKIESMYKKAFEFQGLKI